MASTRPIKQATDEFQHAYNAVLRRARLTSPAPWSYQVVQGVNLGYWMSDATDPSTLKPADIPSAWMLYDADRLPADELAKLQPLAPVYDILLPQGST
jgi:hypothetical protein